MRLGSRKKSRMLKKIASRDAMIKHQTDKVKLLVATLVRVREDLCDIRDNNDGQAPWPTCPGCVGLARADTELCLLCSVKQALELIERD